MTIETEFLFDLHILAAAPVELGPATGATRRVVAITGGRFEGPKLKGRVLPGGADWITALADGSMLLDVRLMLETDDGARLGMAYTGMRRGPPEVLARLARGEAVDPALYYFRTAGRFETAAEPYRWLADHIILATGRRLPEGPVYQVYRLL